MGAGKGSPKRTGKKKKALNAEVSDKGTSVYVSEIPPHKHCFNCGKSIPLDREVCSDRCQEEWDRMLKKKKMLTYLPYIGAVLLIVLYLLIMSNGG
ncbi:MAG: DUF2116 family Zn-ribbon domain-containing protein [Candidatus Thermoplasmatota archaeon]|nr:DUF2116 family Zn-ribbon domain-containing protein [Candidatus Thermoplasmatota archaeon]